MKKWNIMFFRPGANVPKKDGVFGIASDGFCPAGGDGGFIQYEKPVLGEVYSGSFDETIQRVRGAQVRPKNVLVFLKTLDGADRFLERLSGVFPDAAFAGGAAAYTEQYRPRIMPDGRDAAVMLVMQDSVVKAANLHTPFRSVRMERSGRDVARVDGTAIDRWYNEMAEQYSGGVVDLEQVTLSDGHGKNVHFSPAGQKMYANAEFETGDTAQVRVLRKDDAPCKMERFAADEGAVVFGCAGLKGLAGKPLKTGAGSIMGFLFGEVVTLAKPAVANLMMSKIVFR